MKNTKIFIYLIILTLILINNSTSQIENVPASHSVYNFLKRLYIKNIINDYNDAVLPLSRTKIAAYLKTISEKKNSLTHTENKILDDLLVEFENDIKGTREFSFILFEKNNDVVSGLIRRTFHEKEKYLYSFKDENINCFLDGLLNFDFRRFTGTNLSNNASFIEGGFTLRGSLYDKLGYYLNLTNAQFWGSREVLKMDKRIRQSYALSTLESKNFDFLEGYVRFHTRNLSAQIGRERVLWGRSYGDKLYISDYAKVFDAIKIDFEYKSVRYVFMHGWLNGKKGLVYLPEYNNYEPVLIDKYLAAHRLDLSLKNFLQVGIQEFHIYSNRSFDLGYLNPLAFFESVQRSRGERDNGYLGFDLLVMPIKNLELHADIFFDDIEIPKLGKNRWDNKYALQFGLMAVDPFGLKNIDFITEYTQIDPYMFSHNRSRDNSFTSDDVLLGTQLGPNSQSWFFKVNSYLTNRLIISLSYEYQKSGENTYDSTGNLIKNVGGDYLQPLRLGIDPIPTKLLDGNVCNTKIFQIFATYEFINEFFIDLRYKRFESKLENIADKTYYHDFGLALRIDF